MKNTDITIVTPSYNQGRFIEETIKSVISQEGNFTLEHIIMDGGSTDETVEVIKKYERLLEKGEYPVKCRGVRLIWKSEKDRGQAHAVNKGFALATGEVLGWVNSDDTYMPGAVSKALEYFKKNKDVMMVYGEGYHITEAGDIIERYPTEPFRHERLFETCFICQPTAFFRKRVLDEVGYLDEGLHFCMDLEYWLRIGQKQRIAHINEYLANSRWYADTKTLSKRKEFAFELVSMFKKHYADVPAPWIYIYAHETLIERRGGNRVSGMGFKFLWALLFIYKFVEINKKLPLSEIMGWLRKIKPVSH